MKIRGKLALTFTLLLLFGVNGVSSYSIIFIKDFLLKKGVKEIQRDARWMALTIKNLDSNQRFEPNLAYLRGITNYNIALYDQGGKLLSRYPKDKNFNEFIDLPKRITGKLANAADSAYVINESDQNRIYVYASIPKSENSARYVQLSEAKSDLLEPVTTIRWIIYTGIFISIGLIIIVSVLVARSMSRPIVQLTDAATGIAEGDVDRKIKLNRRDEFGTLAESLNQMASKLRSDNEHLKRIYERQRQFYADITHEVRNPLHTIVGSLDMLELENLPEEKRGKYISNAKNQVKRINRLFKDLKTLQRYDSDQQFIQKDNFDISKITGRIEDWYHEKASEKGIAFNVNKDPVTVYADASKIEQVLENLVSNAVKYSQADSIELKYEEEDGKLRVEVCDDGIGIPSEHLPRLFDRFYRTDKARSRDKGGTGLGLAVVKGIINAHDSDITVESEVGKGTKFVFYLSLKDNNEKV
ncbi:MAG TPA: HAMP domain-containing sensor histidine kinase [Balneolales bacterium]|nr:HAMP domain-containing sensor histidine kinase [Balneolales bacterium]